MKRIMELLRAQPQMGGGLVLFSHLFSILNQTRFRAYGSPGAVPLWLNGSGLAREP
jgi:hypothetical protein